MRKRLQSSRSSEGKHSSGKPPFKKASETIWKEMLEDHPDLEAWNHATDGLRLRDIPYIKIRDDQPELFRTPCRIMINAALSKTTWPYNTLMSGYGAGKTAEYLNESIWTGKGVNGDSSVLAPDRSAGIHRMQASTRSSSSLHRWMGADAVINKRMAR